MQIHAKLCLALRQSIKYDCSKTLGYLLLIMQNKLTYSATTLRAACVYLSHHNNHLSASANRFSFYHSGM